MKTKLLYVGRRLNGRDKVVQCFLDPYGKEKFWTGIKYVIQGHYYRAERVKGGITMKIKPEDLGQKEGVTQEERDKWDAEELIVNAHLARRRAVARGTKTVDKIADDFPRLQHLVKDMGYFELNGFITALTDRLHSKSKAKPKRRRIR